MCTDRKASQSRHIFHFSFLQYVFFTSVFPHGFIRKEHSGQIFMASFPVGLRSRKEVKDKERPGDPNWQAMALPWVNCHSLRANLIPCTFGACCHLGHVALTECTCQSLVKRGQRPQPGWYSTGMNRTLTLHTMAAGSLSVCLRLSFSVSDSVYVSVSDCVRACLPVLMYGSHGDLYYRPVVEYAMMAACLFFCLSV